MEDSYEGFTKPEGGKLTFHSDVEDKLFRKFLSKFEGENLWIEIKSKTPTRTQRQNRFYWAYLEILSDHTGYTPKEMHTTFKNEFLEPEETKGLKGKTYQETPTTTNLNKKEFNDYIRQIEMLTEIPAPSKKRYNL